MRSSPKGLWTWKKKWYFDVFQLSVKQFPLRKTPFAEVNIGFTHRKWMIKSEKYRCLVLSTLRGEVSLLTMWYIFAAHFYLFVQCFTKSVLLLYSLSCLLILFCLAAHLCIFFLYPSPDLLSHSFFDHFSLSLHAHAHGEGINVFNYISASESCLFLSDILQAYFVCIHMGQTLPSS